MYAFLLLFLPPHLYHADLKTDFFFLVDWSLLVVDSVSDVIVYFFCIEQETDSNHAT
jgi:hypothetical protein